MAYTEITENVKWDRPPKMSQAYFHKLDVDIILNQIKGGGTNESKLNENEENQAIQNNTATPQVIAGSFQIKYAYMKEEGGVEKECFVLVAVVEGDNGGATKVLDNKGDLMALPCPPFRERRGGQLVPIE